MAIRIPPPHPLFTCISYSVPRSCTVLDPQLRGEERCLRYLQRLTGYLPSVLKGAEERDPFAHEVSQYSVSEARELPSNNLRIDEWWSAARLTCPLLSRVARAYLTIFSGPMIESAFSKMGNILSTNRSRLSIDTYNAQHAIKPHFKGRAVKVFSREDTITTPIHLGRKLVKNMRGASALYREVSAPYDSERLPRKGSMFQML